MTTEKQNKTELTDGQIVELAKEKMRADAPQYTFENKTAFFYFGKIEEHEKYCFGLLETDPEKNTPYPYVWANVVSKDNPLEIIDLGIEQLDIYSIHNYSSKIYPHTLSFSLVYVNEESGIRSVLEKVIKQQSEINAYRRGFSKFEEELEGIE